MKNECCEQGGTCETKPEAVCPTETAECCPVEAAAQIWSRSFFDAMKAAQVEVLKSKMLKAWGPKFDKTADVVLEAMEAQWQATLTKAKAKIDLRDQLVKIFSEEKR